MDIQRTLASRYQLVAHLARGGMADVFEADDQLLNRRVAVKVLHAQYASDQAFVARFRREAQASASLSHPNIVSIYDWGYDAGTYFMVMELIQGRTLQDILRTEGALLPRRAAEIAADVAAALGVAHRAGISHRDVKPGNVMLTVDGSVKVTDFGIARALDDSEHLTKTGAVIGTATYFSPEQAQGMPADGRSDIYSLGVVLYELILGRPPFAGDSPVAVAYQHVSEFAPAPRSIDPELPAPLEEIVLRALEKDPRDRYQSADDMRADLQRYLRGEAPVAAAAPVAAGLPVAPSQDAATELMETPPEPPPVDAGLGVGVYVGDEPRQPIQYGFVLGVVALVALLLLGVFLLFQLLSSDPPVATVAVPNVVGQDVEAARLAMQAVNLAVTTTPVVDSEVAPGLVVSTDPPAGTQVDPETTTVELFFSSGPGTVSVPAVVGQPVAVAEQLLSNADLVAAVTFAFDPEVEEGLVISQDPAAEAEVAPGSTVELSVSSGPEAVLMPGLAGLAERTAIFQLSQAGFTEDQVTVEEEFSAEVEEGIVIRTEPPAGTPVPPFAEITLFVSAGPPEVPDLTGSTVEDARRILGELELQLELDTNTVIVTQESGLVGRIAEQDPAPGTLVDPGTSVRVQLGQLLTVAVPNITGLVEADARAAVEAANLLFEVVGRVAVDLDLVGTVLSQDPAPGSPVPENTPVRVEVGVVTIVDVPDLIGLDEDEAREALDDLFLVLEVGPPVVDDDNVGLVVTQDPEEGTEVEQGTTVTVSFGEASPTTTIDTTTTTTGDE